MAPPEHDRGFAEFVAARSDALLRSAWLLTGDAGRAEDLLQTALAKAWRRWPSVERADSPEAYVRRIIFTTYISWWRRRWRSETPIGDLPEQPGHADLANAVAAQDAVTRALGRLPRRARAVVVLRYVEDRPLAEVAELLGSTPSAVKALAWRALTALRTDPDLLSLIPEGAPA